MYSQILRAAATQRELWTAGLGNWPLWYFSDFVCNKEGTSNSQGPTQMSAISESKKENK